MSRAVRRAPLSGSVNGTAAIAALNFAQDATENFSITEGRCGELISVTKAAHQQHIPVRKAAENIPDHCVISLNLLNLPDVSRSMLKSRKLKLKGLCCVFVDLE